MNRLRLALTASGMTQSDLAELTGISYATIKRLVRPGSNPMLHQALRISAVLQIPVERLFWIDPAHDPVHLPER